MDRYIIATERLGLRRWLPSDTKPFAEMNQDETVMRFFPRKLTNDETFELIKKIEFHFDKNQFGLFAVENKFTREFLGFTGFAIPTFHSFFTLCVEIGWRYKREAWGQGFATEAAIACLKYGFINLKFDKIVSFTSPLNINSEKVMKRIGMKYITDFDHPQIEKNNILCRHVLYEINREYFYSVNSNI
jgi:ribosomal-protein-alanine N-acetyltransferase